MGSTRFFKVARVRSDEGLVVVKVFVKHDPSLPLETHAERLEFIKRSLSNAVNCLPFQRVVVRQATARWVKWICLKCTNFLWSFVVDWKGGAGDARVCKTQFIRSRINSSVSDVIGKEMDYVSGAVRSSPMSQTENMPWRYKGKYFSPSQWPHLGEFNFFFSILSWKIFWSRRGIGFYCRILLHSNQPICQKIIRPIIRTFSTQVVVEHATLHLNGKLPLHSILFTN